MYEIYTDFLIAWIGIFGISHLVFGFCAIVFPFINRSIYLFFCIKLFIFGIKTKTKSIKPDRID